MRERLRRFFFPPRNRSVVRRYGPVAMVVAVPIIILLAIPPVWEYSNSSEFCGTTCHTMPPEYQTYLVSPHARVQCTECHIGRDWIAIQAYRKIDHMDLIFKTIAGDYEYPIRTDEMRPARETCERCHLPEKFSDDSLRVIHRYDDDEENSQYDIYLLMHTGGGSEREGLGFGIHWHIENPIEYITTDLEHQEIPWVRVNTVEGEQIEYTALDSEIDTENLDDYELHEMDCITCHNRISHLIPVPRADIDAALYRGDMSADIPYIRAQAVEVLRDDYETVDEAVENIRGLQDYYTENYPDYYAENEDIVNQAIDVIEQIYRDNTFPEQELDWNTHPNNIGHRDSPGCFRCHDGEHFNEGGEAIRLECNLCHSIPQIVIPGELEPMMPLATGLEPSSHLDSTWIARHHVELDETCSNCHTVENPGGTTDTSFCSNSGCHGVDWEFAGFDAPSLAAELGLNQAAEEDEELSDLALEEDVTYATLYPMFERLCGQCHGETPSAGLRVTDYDDFMAGSNEGVVVVPGNPDGSSLLDVLQDGHFAQPSDVQLEAIRTWIQAGALEGEPIETDAEPAETGPISYEVLQPVFEEQCGACHGESATAGLNVTTYDALLEGSAEGPVIEPGSPAESRIVELLEGDHFGQFSDVQLDQLREWIAAGAPETQADAEAAAAPEPTATEEPPAETETADEAAVTYADVRPVLTETCGSCHGDAATAGLQVTEYDTLLEGSENGPVIEPGSPDESVILSVLEEGHYAELDAEQLDLLSEWIAAGAPESETDAEDAEADAAEATATEEPPAEAEAPPEDSLSYEDIQPVLTETCGSCHGDAATAGLQVTEYEALLDGSENGPVIEPGSPDESVILSVLEEGHYAELDAEQLDLLSEWIAAGAPETDEDAEADAAAATATEEPPAETETTGEAAVTYADVQPVLTETCGSCHGDAATAGLQVTEYEALLEGSENGPVIEPGSPDESVILSVLEEGHYAELDAEQLDLLSEWIAAGAPEDESGESNTASPTESAEESD